MNKHQRDEAKVAKREALFSTEAREEGKGALKRYMSEKKAGLTASAADSKREVKIDNTFAEGRREVADEAKKKARLPGQMYVTKRNSDQRD